MHITIPALQKRPKVMPMCPSEMLCTGTQSSGGQAVRMFVYERFVNVSTTSCSHNSTRRLPANSTSTCGGSWAIISSNQRSAVIETRRHDCASNYAHAQAPCEQEFVLTIIGDLFCLVNTRRRARVDRCTPARLCAPPLQLLPPQLEFDGERFESSAMGGPTRE